MISANPSIIRTAICAARLTSQSYSFPGWQPSDTADRSTLNGGDTFRYDANGSTPEIEWSGMMAVKHGKRGWRLNGLLLLGALGAGCSTPGKVPMQVNITQLADYVNPARPPECNIQVLDTMPLTTFKEVAIVEVWADLSDDQSDVLPALKRRACETGADALVILNTKHQDIKNFLYQASPNETLNETTQQNVYAGQGEYIKEAEHTRRIGEAGHNGYYVDAVAINYTIPGPKSDAGGDANVKSRPNG
jgi:hypothetical protein